MRERAQASNLDGYSEHERTNDLDDLSKKKEERSDKKTGRKRGKG